MTVAICILLFVVGCWLVLRTDEKHPTFYQECEGFVGGAMVVIAACTLLVKLILTIASKT